MRSQFQVPQCWCKHGRALFQENYKLRSNLWYLMNHSCSNNFTVHCKCYRLKTWKLYFQVVWFKIHSSFYLQIGVSSKTLNLQQIKPYCKSSLYILTDFTPIILNTNFAAKMRPIAWRRPSTPPTINADETQGMCSRLLPNLVLIVRPVFSGSESGQW